MTATNTLKQGREAFERQSWVDAYTRLSVADEAHLLDPADLEKLAIAAYLTEKDLESIDAWTRAHHELLNRGDIEGAARCAFWLTFELLSRGEHARASGWGARGRRLLDEAQRDCVEQGYLRLPAAFQCLAGGDVAGAYALFSEVAEIADRFGDPDLTALARHSRGRMLIRLEKTEEGVKLLDEAMAAVEAGDLSPVVVGVVYCSVIEGCMEIFDFRRAQEWTVALKRWCDSQPDLVAYRGECQVRRAEILQLQGAWQDAIDAAQQACVRFLQVSPQPAAGVAFYQKAELHRLRGEFAEAEEAYRQASQWGGKAQPGLAQLRLSQGRLKDAEMAIRRVINEARDRVARCRLLPAYVEIVLAVGDVNAARTAADELTRIAEDVDAPLLRAIAARSRGAILLAEGEAAAALAELQQAQTTWQDFGAPHEIARVRVLKGLACRKLEDEDTAVLEFDAARSIFQQLGAAPDFTRLEELTHTSASKAVDGLTRRQVEVLCLIASGKTNREIADALFISEKTVARHVSNIFEKLDLPNRAAAAAYAYQEGLA